MNYLVTFIIFLLANNLICQVQFSELKDWNSVKRQAKTENKLIHLFAFSNDCQECEQVGEFAMNNFMLTEKFNTNFINIKAERKSALFEEILNSYKSFQLGYHSIFNSEGFLLNTIYLTATVPEEYFKFANQGIENAKYFETIMKAKSKYLSSDTKEDLYDYIIKLRKVDNYPIDIMDDYIKKLSNEELNSQQTIIFLQGQGSNIYSNTYKFLNTIDQRIKDSLWYLLENKERAKINNRFRFISHSLIRESKDENMMKRLVVITKNQYSYSTEGMKYADKMLIDFYKECKMDEKFIQTQINFCNQYLLKNSIEDLNRIDEEQRNIAFSNRSKDGKIKFSPPSQFIAMDLNNAAYTVFEKTNDLYYLNQALIWSKKSIDIIAKSNLSIQKEIPAFYDTYAQIHHKIGNEKEALFYQKKAFELNSTSMMKSEKIIENYNKMIKE